VRTRTMGKQVLRGARRRGAAGRPDAGEADSLIAVTSLKRVSSLPDVPTVAESGVPGYEAISWYMLLTSSKTPAAIMRQLNEETVKAMTTEDMRELMARGSVEPLGNTPAEAMEFLKAEIAKSARSSGWRRRR
jgi:tripartite-type tricarboxylate transporter receptor subunit TctC